MLKWSKGYEWDNKIQMQNLFNTLRINELEATHPLESRRKKISTFPPEQAEPMPCALLSRQQKKNWILQLESYSLLFGKRTAWASAELTLPQAHQRSP